MKSKFVALSQEKLLCDATGKADIPAVTHDAMLRLIGGQRTGPEKPESTVAKLMISANIVGWLYGSGELWRLIEEDPRWRLLLLSQVGRMADFLKVTEEKLRAACSDAAQPKKRLRK